MAEVSYIGGVPALVFEQSDIRAAPVRGLSGDVLEVTCTAELVDIVPQLRIDGVHFKASLRYLPEGLTMDFSVKTKDTKTGVAIHPDLHAGKLLSRTIQYFDEQAGPVERLEATWREGGTNHDMFYAALFAERLRPPENSKRRAAFATWTARQIAAQGFIHLEHIKEAGDSDGSFVDAMFCRSATY